MKRLMENFWMPAEGVIALILIWVFAIGMIIALESLKPVPIWTHWF